MINRAKHLHISENRRKERLRPFLHAAQKFNSHSSQPYKLTILLFCSVLILWIMLDSKRV